MKYIYEYQNINNGKVYVGQTNNMQRRAREHIDHARKDKSPFHEDILKFGIDAFSLNIISTCSDEEADAKEKERIAFRKDTLGEQMVYNICSGGIGGMTHDVSGVNNPMYGRYKTQVEKENLSNKLKGKKKPAGFGDKVSQVLKGKPKSASAVAKKSHKISTINKYTGEIRSFPSKASMSRELHCDPSTILSGGSTKAGWILYES